MEAVRYSDRPACAYHRAFPLELHFVHRDDAGHLAVVGVLVDTGPATPALDPLLAVHPEAGGPAIPVSGPRFASVCGSSSGSVKMSSVIASRQSNLSAE